MCDLDQFATYHGNRSGLSRATIRNIDSGAPEACPMSAQNPASRSLRTYGQAQRLLMMMNLITGAAIWAAAGLLEHPMASPEIYGAFINGVTAEWWSIPLVIGASIHLLGQVINGDDRLPAWFTPAWRLVGALLCASVMIAFTYGGLFASPKLFTIIHFIQAFFTAGLSTWCVYLAWTDLRPVLQR